MNFTQPLSAQSQHARKIYTSTALEHNVSVLFGIDYTLIINKEIKMQVKLGLLVATVLASGSCFAADAYKVSTSVFKDGELIASPMMLVNAEEMASIAVDTEFQYNLTVKPYNEHTAKVVTALKVGDDVAEHETTVAYDKEATVDNGKDKLTLLVRKITS